MASEVLQERYAIEKQLSKNAGRRTLLARDLQTQELVVIKLLTFGGDICWDDLKLFEREAQTLQQLSHPAIPRYLDYFEVDTPTGKGFALVQSYIPAKSLEEWLKSGRTFSEAEVKQLAKALLEILDYLHNQQPPVIHRDIKPSNILLANRSGNSVGDVYLVDFGSVQNLAVRKGSTITVVGTYGYMPPEQFGGRNVPASDIYSLGATLIYLVTGRHPAELSQGNLQIQFESTVNLNPDLIAWLKWMTQPSLNRRLASAKEALDALENPRQQTDISTVKQKPFGTRIELKKDGSNLKVIIPPKRLSFWNFYWLLVVALFDLCIILSPFIWIIQAMYDPFQFRMAHLMFFSSLWLLGSLIGYVLLWEPIVNFFSSTRIEIDRRQISVTHLWFWYRIRVVPTNKKSMMQGIVFIYLKSNYGQNKYYKILRNSQLTTPEIEWLTHEISAISNGKITIESADLQIH
jgi:serine/threonine protein kinase